MARASGFPLNHALFFATQVLVYVGDSLARVTSNYYPAAMWRVCAVDAPTPAASMDPGTPDPPPGEGGSTCVSTHACTHSPVGRGGQEEEEEDQGAGTHGRGVRAVRARGRHARCAPPLTHPLQSSCDTAARKASALNADATQSERGCIRFDSQRKIRSKSWEKVTSPKEL